MKRLHFCTIRLFLSCLAKSSLPVALRPLYPQNMSYRFDLGQGQNRRSFVPDCHFEKDVTLMVPFREVTNFDGYYDYDETSVQAERQRKRFVNKNKLQGKFNSW